MRCRSIFFLIVIFFGSSVSAQHLQLINDKGEIGAFAGNSKYFGDIYSDIKDFNINYGFFYKRQFNGYIGIRLNYEKINLSADDKKSTFAVGLIITGGIGKFSIIKSSGL